MNLGKFFFEVDTQIVDGPVGYYFQRKEDFDKRIEQFVSEHGIEAIQAIGEYL